jgi:hypothetical protein
MLARSQYPNAADTCVIAPTSALAETSDPSSYAYDRPESQSPLRRHHRPTTRSLDVLHERT